MSVSQASLFLLFWVIHMPFFFLSPFPVVSLHHVFIFLLPHSSVSLPFCSSISPLPRPHQFPLPLQQTVCAVSFCLLLHFAFFSFPPIFLTVLHISLVFYFTWSKILRFWTEICPIHILLLSEWIWSSYFMPLASVSLSVCEGIGRSRK